MGLAVDPHTYSYNVVFANFDPPYSSLLPIECLVFNSETNAWKIFGFDSSISQEHIHNGQNRTVSVGRALYWLTMSSKIIVLDLYNEVWKKISLPYQIENKDPLHIYLLELEGSLSVIGIYKKWMYICVLKDGLREEWVLTNKVRLASIGKELREPTFPITLNREFIFLRVFGDVWLYDHRSKLWKKVHKEAWPCPDFAFRSTLCTC